MAPSWITISNTLPGGPSKFSTSSARMMWPVEDTGRNSVRPSTTPISTVFHKSVGSIPSVLEALGARQAIGKLERLPVGQPIGLGLLQQHSAAAAHLRHLLEGEDQELAALAQRGNRIGAFRHDGEDLCLLVARQVQDLLAVARLRHHLVFRHDEAAAGLGGDQKLAAAPQHFELHDVLLVAELDHETDRLA